MIRRHNLAAAAITLLMLAGCSTRDRDDAALIQPIESILATDIEIIADPSGTTATLAVNTTIPVACAIIYGIDGSFGSIAVDNDMQGGAHQDHHPLLTGLAPDTDYQYVLQGSDASGSIYRSDTLTFRTPPATENAFGSNIATTGTITAVSSEFSDSFAAANTIDGDLGTEWSTAADGNNAWIEIDLGQLHEITAVSYHTRQMTDGTAITETFTVTIDGQTLDPFTVASTPIALDEPVTGRVVRFDADQTTGGNTGATEIEVYASQ